MQSRVFFQLIALLLPLGAWSQFRFDDSFSTAIGSLALLKGAALIGHAIGQSGAFGGGNQFSERDNRFSGRRNRPRGRGGDRPRGRGGDRPRGRGGDRSRGRGGDRRGHRPQSHHDVHHHDIIHHHVPHHHHDPHHFHVLGKRSVETLAVEAPLAAAAAPFAREEDFLLAGVAELDREGCVLKLLCSVQAKSEAERTFEEAVLATMFNGTEEVTPYNANFVAASVRGREAVEAETECDEAFPTCQLDAPQLQELLQEAWGCNSAVLRHNQVETDRDDDKSAKNF